MDLKLKIKNIGKLSDATIRIGRFTVFAGPNSTGKSFVSKSLYSIFDAANANLVEVYIKSITLPIKNYLRGFLILDQPNSYILRSFYGEIARMESACEDFSIEDIEGLDEITHLFSDSVKNMHEKFPAVRSVVESSPVQQAPLFPDSSVKEDFINGLKEYLNKLQYLLNNTGLKEAISSGLDQKIKENLIQNFQVPNLSDLSGDTSVPSEVDIENLGKVELSNEKLKFEIGYSGLSKLQQYSKVIYLESPVYWKLKNALEGIRLSPRFRYSHREQISGIPGYFYGLASALMHQYSGGMDFPEIYDKLTGKDILGGKIVISDSGDLSFQENDRSFSLPVTALGVANLGILALLIERKVLDKGSFIFIDEPEAHLHPAWQVVMAETLFELAKGGANVVIATHSADILKWLEVHIKKNPSDEGMVALNKFPVNGDDADDQDFSDKMAAIKQELTRPFAKLYTAGL